MEATSRSKAWGFPFHETHSDDAAERLLEGAFHVAGEGLAPRRLLASMVMSCQSAVGSNEPYA